MKGEIGQFPKRFFLSGNQRLDYPGEGFIMAKMSADFYATFPRLRVQIPLATCGPQYCANLLAGTFTRSCLASLLAVLAV